MVLKPLPGSRAAGRPGARGWSVRSADPALGIGGVIASAAARARAPLDIGRPLGDRVTEPRRVLVVERGVGHLGSRAKHLGVRGDDAIEPLDGPDAVGRAGLRLAERRVGGDQHQPRVARGIGAGRLRERDGIGQRAVVAPPVGDGGLLASLHPRLEGER